MASGFKAKCRECGHNWEGLRTSLTLGPHSHKTPNTNSWSCPSCYRMLYLPQSLERKRWQEWHEQYLKNTREIANNTMLDLLAKIDTDYEALGWYTPHTINIKSLNCPGCSSAMVKYGEQNFRDTCPACGGNDTESFGYSFVSISTSDDGFG